MGFNMKLIKSAQHMNLNKQYNALKKHGHNGTTPQPCVCLW